MKKTMSVLALALVMILSSFTTVHASALAEKAAVESKEAIKARVAAMTDAEKEERAKYIKARVEEIRTMDKSMLNRAERKELRKELQSMKYEAKAIGSGGVYISLAGILLIILLLILIL